MTAVDLDGDGLDEVFVGARGADVVYLFTGSSGDFDPDPVFGEEEPGADDGGSSEADALSAFHDDFWIPIDLDDLALLAGGVIASAVPGGAMTVTGQRSSSGSSIEERSALATMPTRSLWQVTVDHTPRRIMSSYTESSMMRPSGRDPSLPVRLCLRSLVPFASRLRQRAAT